MPYCLKIKQIQYPAVDAVTLRFDKVNGFAHYLPGQHVFVSAKLDGERVTRTYSFCTSPDVDDDIAITIRRLPGGKMSGFLIDHAAVGMELELEGPFGEFTTQPDPSQGRHLIMFAAGSGITPLMSMLRSVLYKEPHAQVSLIYANRSFDRIIFYQQLQRLQAQFANLEVYHALLDTSTVTKEEKEQIFYEGELNRLIVKKMVKKLLAKYSLLLLPEFYLCGPFGYMQMAEEALTALNISKDKIFKEHFFIPEQSQENDTDFSSLPDRTVIINWQGSKYHVLVPSGKSILQAALDVGINLPYSCKEAQCGTCRSRLLSGEVKMKRNHILTAEELEEDQVLLCQGYAMTDDVEVQPLHQPG